MSRPTFQVRCIACRNVGKRGYRRVMGLWLCARCAYDLQRLRDEAHA